MKTARQRVVRADYAAEIVRGMVSSVMEFLIEAQSARVGENGVALPIPVNVDGDIAHPGNVAEESEDENNVFSLQFLREQFGTSADKWTEAEFDWSETEKFKEIP